MPDELKLAEDPELWTGYLSGKRLYKLFRCLLEPDTVTEAERQQAAYLYSVDEDPEEALASLARWLTEMDKALSRRREDLQRLLVRASYEGSVVSVDRSGVVVRFVLDDDTQTRRFSYEQVHAVLHEGDVVEVESTMRRRVISDAVVLDPKDQVRWQQEFQREQQARRGEPRADFPE
jgi:hypothetical protein